MLIECTDEGRGPFDGLTGKYTIYYNNMKHYILYKKCNDFAGRYRNISRDYIGHWHPCELHVHGIDVSLGYNLLPRPVA